MAAVWDAGTGNLIASREGSGREFVVPTLEGDGFFSIHHSAATSVSLGSPLGIASLTGTAIGSAERNPIFRKSPSDAAAEPCDDLAGSPYDPLRVTDGVLPDKLDKAVAELACRRAIEKVPSEPRFHFELARVLYMMSMAAQSYEREGMRSPAARSSADLGKEADLEYRIAEEKGYTAAAYNLAVYAMLRSSSDIHDTIARWSDALANGLSVAGFELAKLYLYGSHGAEPDLTLAIQSARRGASLGDPNCHRLLAQLYETGLNVQADLKEALIHHALASRIFRDIGDEKEALYDAYRRSTLARHLPFEVVYTARKEVDTWRASDK